MDVKSKAIRKTPSTMIVILMMLLLTGRPVIGSVLHLRQDDNTDISSVIAATAPPESSTAPFSASATGSASDSVLLNTKSASESTSSPSVTGDPDRPVLASPTSSGTEAISATSTTTASATNSTTSSNSTLSETNDPNGCHREFIPGIDQDPFCDPTEGSTLDVNASYKVTWDATQFPPNENITVTLHSINATSNSTTPSEILLTQTVNSASGFIFINTTPAMLNGSTNATLYLSANATYDDEPHQYQGPLFYLLDKTKPGDNSTNSSSNSSSSSTSNKLGEKVGIPVGLIFFLIILAALAFLLFRYRRNNAGYGTGKSLGQRTNTGSLRGNGGGAAAARGVGGRGHKRQESFHDEPTSGGVELQDRSRGLTGEDNWEWGRDSVGSPVSPISPTGNQFRDELQRQKTGGRR